MGFFRKLFGDDDGSEAKYLPQTYAQSTSSGGPNTKTDTTLSASETPKKAEQADTSAYDESERKRKRKNGVNGSFGFTGDKMNGNSEEKTGD